MSRLSMMIFAATVAPQFVFAEPGAAMPDLSAYKQRVPFKVGDDVKLSNLEGDLSHLNGMTGSVVMLTQSGKPVVNVKHSDGEYESPLADNFLTHLNKNKRMNVKKVHRGQANRVPSKDSEASTVPSTEVEDEAPQAEYIEVDASDKVTPLQKRQAENSRKAGIVRRGRGRRVQAAPSSGASFYSQMQQEPEAEVQAFEMDDIFKDDVEVGFDMFAPQEENFGTFATEDEAASDDNEEAPRASRMSTVVGAASHVSRVGGAMLKGISRHVKSATATAKADTANPLIGHLQAIREEEDALKQDEELNNNISYDVLGGEQDSGNIAGFTNPLAKQAIKEAAKEMNDAELAKHGYKAVETLPDDVKPDKILTLPNFPTSEPFGFRVFEHNLALKEICEGEYAVNAIKNMEKYLGWRIVKINDVVINNLQEMRMAKLELVDGEDVKFGLIKPMFLEKAGPEVQIDDVYQTESVDEGLMYGDDTQKTCVWPAYPGQAPRMGVAFKPQDLTLLSVDKTGWVYQNVKGLNMETLIGWRLEKINGVEVFDMEDLRRVRDQFSKNDDLVMSFAAPTDQQASSSSSIRGSLANFAASVRPSFAMPTFSIRKSISGLRGKSTDSVRSADAPPAASSSCVGENPMMRAGSVDAVKKVSTQPAARDMKMDAFKNKNALKSGKRGLRGLKN